MTITRAPGFIFRSSSSAARPSMPGSLTSRMIRSGGSRRAISRPCSAVGAVRTEWPSDVRNFSKAQVMDCSSSTTRTVPMRPPILPASAPFLSLLISSCQGYGGQFDPEGRAAVRTLKSDTPAVILDDALGQGEAEADAVGPSGDERLEDPVAQVRRDARAGVGHREPHASAGPFQRDGQAPALGHRLRAVQDEVHRGPLKAVAVARHLRGRVDPPFEVDAEVAQLAG